jgi:hypothetical protein
MKTKITLLILILSSSINIFSQQMGSIDLITPSKISNGIANRWTIYNMTGVYGNSLQFWAYDNLGCVPGGMCTNRFTIMDNGNVGIGVDSPTQKLDVNGNINMAGVSGRRLFMGGAGGSTFGIAYDSTNPNYGIFYTEGEPDYVSISPNGNSTAGVMNVFGNGNVGIGTTSPDEKLTVKGKIHAQEVKVDMLGPLVPDYVFANDYKLKTLKEVEDYINKNSHLPEIPSAQEIEKNGLMLAEMNMLLLKKMEEMTLYIIEQNKISKELIRKVIVLEKALKKE